MYLIEARGHDSLMWGSGSSELASPQTIFMTFLLLYNNHLQNFIIILLYFSFATSTTKKEKKHIFFSAHLNKNYYFLYYLRSEAAAAFIVSIFREFIFSSRNIDFLFTLMSWALAVPLRNWFFNIYWPNQVLAKGWIAWALLPNYSVLAI